MALFPFDYLTQKSFNSNVLIGNWFEERCDRMVDKKAVVPGVYGQSVCPIEKTIYEATYKVPALDTQELREFKRQRFINKQFNRETHFPTKDSDEFDHNMTTTMDIMYNIRPQKAKLTDKITQKLVDKSEDLMRSYNQPTETGLLQGLRCKRLHQNGYFPATTYKEHFITKSTNCPREKNLFERCRYYKAKPPFHTDDW